MSEIDKISDASLINTDNLPIKLISEDNEMDFLNIKFIAPRIAKTKKKFSI